MKINEIIRKVEGGYRLYSKKGRNLGTYPSKKGAEKRERQVQYFKHNESLDEGLVDWVSRKMGKSWGKVGDRVRGSTVAAYLRSNTYFSDRVLKELASYNYQLKTISLADAKKYREFSDANASDDIMDPMKLDRARGRNITPDSLIKNPPVLDADGYIWDGNHRMARAIELGMKRIPVLMQVSKAPVTEAFDKPYPYKTGESYSGWYAEFNTYDGDKVKVTAYKSRDAVGSQLVHVWKIDFFRNYSQDLTGEGDAFRIFSTVMKAISEFLQEKSPEYVEFRALKSEADDKNTKDKSSRQKLYSRLVKKYASKDYKIKEITNKKQTKYFLTRKITEITEAFDQPYPITMRKSEGGDYDGVAKLADGSNLEVTIDLVDEGFEGMDTFDVSFYRGGTADTTGEGDAFKVFATVMSAIKQFIMLYKRDSEDGKPPYLITFSASKSQGDAPGGNAGSRAKLYDRMVKRFAQQMGYTVYVEDYEVSQEYELTRKR